MIRLLVLGLCLFSGTAASAVTLTPLQAWLELTTGGYTSLTQSHGVPFAATDSSANPSNGSHAQAQYEVTPNSIDITYSLSRPPHNDDVQNEFAQANGYVYFTVDQAAQYVLSGEMDTVDSEGRNTTQWLQLLRDGPNKVFENYQLSHATPNPHFTLGEQAGDFDNGLTGTISGTLLPGHIYRFEYYSRLLDEPATSLQTATATGFYSLVIIPEPSTALLVSLGLGVLTPRGRDSGRQTRPNRSGTSRYS